MRSRAVAVFLALCAASTLALLAVAAADDRELAFTLGVRATKGAVVIGPGSTGCQDAIPAPTSFGAVEMTIGTFFGPGPPAELTVLDMRTRERVGGAQLAAGYPDNRRHRIELGEVKGGRRVALCIHNQGDRKVAVYGGESDYSLTSRGTVDGRDANADMDLTFLRSEPSSMLRLVPDAFERMALWHPGGVTTFWLLALLVVAAVPALLARALAFASD